MSDKTLHLCEERFALDADVIRLYEGAFPPSVRQSVEHLQASLSAGRLLYHRTSDANDELLCFTLVNPADGFSFLSYMATNPAKRSSGIGSRHLVRLLEILKARFPDHQGMCFEIESTHPRLESVDQKEQKDRQRRKQFYQRAGARVLCEEGVYITPNMTDGSKEWEGELMAFEFGEPICGTRLKSIIIQIFRLCYQLDAGHPLVQKVLHHFAPCIDPRHGTAGDTTAEAPPANVPADDSKPATSSPDEKQCGCLFLNWWHMLMDILFGWRKPR